MKTLTPQQCLKKMRGKLSVSINMARDYSKSKDAQLRATQKYNKENTIQVVCRFNKNTDADIVERLQEVENKNGYIKELIRKDIQSRS